MSRKSQIQIAIERLQAKRAALYEKFNAEIAGLDAAINELAFTPSHSGLKKPRERKPRAVVPTGSAA